MSVECTGYGYPGRSKSIISINVGCAAEGSNLVQVYYYSCTNPPQFVQVVAESYDLFVQIRVAVRLRPLLSHEHDSKCNALQTDLDRFVLWPMSYATEPFFFVALMALKWLPTCVCFFIRKQILLDVKGKQNAYAFDLVLDSRTTQVIELAPTVVFLVA